MSDTEVTTVNPTLEIQDGTGEGKSLSSTASVQNTRAALYAEMARKRRAEVAGERDHGHLPIGDTQEQQGDKAVKAKGEPAGGAPPVGTPSYLIKRNDGSWALKLKVDGVDEEEDLDSILAGAQKLRSADRRLREAAAKDREVHDRLQQIIARERALESRSNAAGAIESPDMRDGIKNAFSKLVAGEDDGAVDSLASVLSSLRVREQTPDQTRQIATEAIEQQLRHERIVNAKERFMTDPKYQRLLNNEELYGMVDRQTAKIIQEEPGSISDPYNVMVRAAELTQKWVDSIAPPTPVTGAKRDRKESAIPAVTPSGVRAPIVQNVETPIPTQKERVRDLQRRRGQIYD